ncbi:MAG: dihydroneopterin triphosphate diphosphatase [Zoogloeaceae bacterium]|nr:dihydroneopterin triphosphate diphosphatase [Zoogloeaceae bacterium]
MPPYKIPVSVLVILHSPALDILLLERALHPGYWQSVTGSREATDATLIQTALREVAEETGILAAATDLLDWHLAEEYDIFPEWRDRYAPGVTRNTEHVFSLAIPPAAPIRLAPAEHRACCWLPLQSAAERCFSPSNRAALLALPERLGKPPL